MLKTKTLLLCLLAAPAFAQYVSVSGTNVQAVLSYTAPTSDPCTITASNLGVQNVTDVYDMDGALFANQNHDLSRPDTQVNGLYRQVILGHRTSAKATDGKFYSLALQANTSHSVTVNCPGNGSNGWVDTEYFTTQNIPLANSGPDFPPYDPAAWGGWAWPTIDYNDKTKAYVDPMSGALIKRATGPGEMGVSSSQRYNLATVAQINTADGGLFVVPHYSSGVTPLFRHWGYEDESFVHDTKFHLTASASASNPVDRTVSVCLSVDFGQTCIGSAVDFVLPQGTASEVTGPASFDQFPDTGWFHGWGDAPIRTEQLTEGDDYAFTVNLSGQTVTWVGGSQGNAGDTKEYFPVNVLVPGAAIYISGSSCPNGGICTIQSIQDPQHLTIANTGIPAKTNAYAQFPNFGFKILKKTNVGTWTYQSSSSDYQGSEGGNVGDQGTDQFCNGTAVTDANGQQWYMCLFWGNANRIAYYAVNKTTGESRIINAFTAINGNVYFGSSPFDLYVTNTDTDPTEYGHEVNGVAVQLHCVYQVNDPTYGQFKAFYSSNEINGNPAVYGPNACTPVNAANNSGVITLINQQHPEIDTSYFNSSVITLGIDGYTVVRLFGPTGQANGISGNRLFWFCLINGSTVVDCENNFQKYPLRWSHSHGDIYNSGVPNVLEINTQEALTQYTVNVTNTISHLDGNSCSGYGITNPKWIAAGATGNNCLSIHATGEPLSTANGVNDLGLNVTQGTNSAYQLNRPVAWAHNSSGCNGDGTTNTCALYLQDLAEGDALNANDGSNIFTSEQFLIVKVTKNQDSSVDLIVARAYTPWPEWGWPYKSDHSPRNYAVWPPQSAGTGGTYFFDVTNLSQGFLVDNPYIYIGHSFNYINTQKQLVALGVDDPHLFAGFDEMGGGSTGYGARYGTYPSILGHDTDHAMAAWVPFAGDANGFQNSNSTSGLQQHPGGIIYKAPAHCENPNVSCDESFWALDAHPIGPNQGGKPVTYPQYQYPVSGTSNVYRLGIPLWASPLEEYGSYANIPYFVNGQQSQGLNPAATNPPHVSGHWAADIHRKTRTQYAWVGEHLLQDISGPSSQITDSNPYTFCVADFAGECVAGSHQYDVYVSVPNAGPFSSTTPQCEFIDMNENVPCAATLGAVAQQFVQFGIDKQDTFGDRHRILGYGFGRFTEVQNYFSLHSIPSADWWPFQNIGNGYRADIFLMKNPGWPKPDSEVRHNFVNVPVSINGASGDTARIRFGYNSQLYCGTRLETCTTAKSSGDTNVPQPYSWLSEPQTWIAINGTTTLKIPAIAGRVLYYQIEVKHSDNSTTLGPIQVTAVQ